MAVKAGINQKTGKAGCMKATTALLVKLLQQIPMAAKTAVRKNNPI